MDRLRDRTDPLSCSEAEAIALLRSVQPYRPAAGMKQRVRMQLVSRERMKQVPFFRPAVLVALLLLAAGASAAIGGALVVSRQRSTSAVGATVAQAVLLPRLQVPPALSNHDSNANTLLLPPVHSDDLPLALEAEAPSRQSSPSPSGNESHTTAKNANALRSKETAQPEVAKQSEDVKLVFDAMRALRRDGRPDVASRQLEQYLRRFPGGTLAEEALALSIEAANVRGDPQAKDLANRYLARYPSGRFQKAAERVRARFSP